MEQVVIDSFEESVVRVKERTFVDELWKTQWLVLH